MGTMSEYRSVFVICRSDGRADQCDTYSAHGCMGGMEDAIGYTPKKELEAELRRKFQPQEAR